MSLLGIKQIALAKKLNVGRSTVNNWMQGLSRADRDTAEIMVERWQIELDSLFARRGTKRLEQSPALKRAVEDFADHVLHQNRLKNTPTQRLIFTYEFLRKECDFGVDGWCDWLGWEVDDWNHVVSGELTTPDTIIDRAAFLLGWYDNKEAWYHWLKDGSTTLLEPISESTLKSLLSVSYQSGFGRVELRRLIEEQRK